MAYPDPAMQGPQGTAPILPTFPSSVIRHPAPVPPMSSSVMPRLPPVPQTHLFGENCHFLTREIWAQNLSDSFVEMSMLPFQYPIVAVDCEFARVSGNEKPAFPYADSRRAYEGTKVYVDGGSLVQAGFVFTDGDMLLCPNELYSFNFSLGENDRYAASPVKFLQNHGHDLNRHRYNGIDPAAFADLLPRFSAIGNSSVIWVGFQGESDMGYLVQFLKGGASLPESRFEFLSYFRENFPNYYDVKFLAAYAYDRLGFTSPLLGPLCNIADKLNVSRLGSIHSATSDALLTLRCFMVMKSRLGIHLKDYKGMFFWINKGDFPQRPLFLPNVDISVVSVGEDNLEETFADIRRLLPQYPLIGVLVRYAGRLAFPGTVSYYACTDLASCYRGLRAGTELIKNLSVALCIGNGTGQVGFNTVWDFIFGEGAPMNSVSKVHFANLLTSTGAVLDQQVTWTCFNGAVGMAIILKLLLGERALPPTSEGFARLYASFFPSACDIGMFTWCNELESLMYSLEVPKRHPRTHEALDCYGLYHCSALILGDLRNAKRLKETWGLLRSPCYHNHVLGSITR